MTRVSANGSCLNVERCGEGEPLVLLHGFTGSAATWRDFQNLPFQSIAIDLPGHGKSDSLANPERYRLDRLADDLLACLDAERVDRFHLLGYSLGGRVAMHLALQAPNRVRSLLLESTSPGIEDLAEREARARDDEALARFIEKEGLQAFVDRWERLPLFATQQRLSPDTRAALRAQRMTGSPTGLAASLRGSGAGLQTPLWDRLDELEMPVLLLTGCLDGKYSAIMRRMAALLPRATVEIVPGAGHAVHLEAPAVFEQAVTSFLASQREEVLAARRAKG
ncbi:MAG: 2-succinyl-6-hydroxy-2,4-cyclohexadiene-1-carboxylate synthase [Chloroflexota bacterium]|nr:2-succinyl-6-hydroxy-2,4-cyclohexadiene-1-carboxylate synthase [Chloroflexota bacterium]